MNQQQQQQREQLTPQEGNQQAPSPLPRTAVATGHLEAMTADLEKIKKNEQVLKMAMAGMAKIPALSGGETSARVLIENIKQQSGE